MEKPLFMKISPKANYKFYPFLTTMAMISFVTKSDRD